MFICVSYFPSFSNQSFLTMNRPPAITGVLELINKQTQSRLLKRKHITLNGFIKMYQATLSVMHCTVHFGSHNDWQVSQWRYFFYLSDMWSFRLTMWQRKWQNKNTDCDLSYKDTYFNLHITPAYELFMEQLEPSIQYWLMPGMSSSTDEPWNRAKPSAAWLMRCLLISLYNA